MTAFTFYATCSHCEGDLDQVNAGFSDGRVSNWVGACRRCSKQYAIVAEISRVPSRGSGAH